MVGGEMKEEKYCRQHFRKEDKCSFAVPVAVHIFIVCVYVWSAHEMRS